MTVLSVPSESVCPNRSHRVSPGCIRDLASEPVLPVDLVPFACSDEAVELIRFKVPEANRDDIIRAASAMARVHSVYPRVVRVAAGLLENWYSSNFAADPERDPLLHFCYQQVGRKSISLLFLSTWLIRMKGGGLGLSVFGYLDQ